MRIGKLGKGLKQDGVLERALGPHGQRCAADGLQTPTDGASNSNLPTDNAAQNPGPGLNMQAHLHNFLALVYKEIN